MTNPTISCPHYAKISIIIHTLKLGFLPSSTKQMMQLQELQRKIGKEIKKLRCMNDWTQEEVAEKLDICRNAYGDMERGETDINLSRLMQVSELFGIEPNYFFDTNEQNVFSLSGIQQNAQTNKEQHNHWHVHTIEENNLQHELEKAQLLLAEREKENQHLKVQITQLQEINVLLKQTSHD